MTPQEKFEKCMAKFGYLVMGYTKGGGPMPLPEVGDIIGGPLSLVPGPFRVIGTTIRKEFVRQGRFLGVQRLPKLDAYFIVVPKTSSRA